MMRPKELKWTCQSKRKDHLIGRVTGNKQILVEIHQMDANKHLLLSNLHGQRSLIIHGLENAKNIAQEHFNAYATSLLE